MTTLASMSVLKFFRPAGSCRSSLIRAADHSHRDDLRKKKGREEEEKKKEGKKKKTGPGMRRARELCLSPLRAPKLLRMTGLDDPLPRLVWRPVVDFNKCLDRWAVE